MRIRNAACTIAAACAVLGAAGCAEKCPTESPNVEAIQSCTVPPGATVSMKVRVCEKCNQTATTCQVDIQGTIIQLDPVSEACSDSSGCPPSCSPDPNITCTFSAPTVEDTYDVFAFDPSTGGNRTGQLVVMASATPSCAFP
jgi:hypothetical protein